MVILAAAEEELGDPLVKHRSFFLDQPLMFSRRQLMLEAGVTERLAQRAHGAQVYAPGSHGAVAALAPHFSCALPALALDR